MRGGATQPKGSLGRDRLDIGDAANAIRSKNLSVVAHPANSTSRCDIRKLETSGRRALAPDRNLIGLKHEDDFLNAIGVARHDLFCAFLCSARLLPHIPPLRIQLI